MLVNSIADSLGVAGLGIIVVLAVLALLALFLLVLGRVMRSRTPAVPAEAAPVSVAAPAPAPAPTPAAAPVPAGMRPLPEHESQGELTLIRVDEPTAAMLMAIVADELQTPLNCLRFKQIKAL